jgi:hypothetical protein
MDITAKREYKSAVTTGLEMKSGCFSNKASLEIFCNEDLAGNMSREE